MVGIVYLEDFLVGNMGMIYWQELLYFVSMIVVLMIILCDR